MNFPSNSKLMLSHEDNILHWMNYQYSEIRRMEYIKNVGFNYLLLLVIDDSCDINIFTGFFFL